MPLPLVSASLNAATSSSSVRSGIAYPNEIVALTLHEKRRRHNTLMMAHIAFAGLLRRVCTVYVCAFCEVLFGQSVNPIAAISVTSKRHG